MEVFKGHHWHEDLSTDTDSESLMGVISKFIRLFEYQLVPFRAVVDLKI